MRVGQLLLRLPATADADVITPQRRAGQLFIISGVLSCASVEQLRNVHTELSARAATTAAGAAPLAVQLFQILCRLAHATPYLYVLLKTLTALLHKLTTHKASFGDVTPFEALLRQATSVVYQNVDSPVDGISECCADLFRAALVLCVSDAGGGRNEGRDDSGRRSDASDASGRRSDVSDAGGGRSEGCDASGRRSDASTTCGNRTVALDDAAGRELMTQIGGMSWHNKGKFLLTAALTDFVSDQTVLAALAAYPYSFVRTLCVWF